MEPHWISRNFKRGDFSLPLSFEDKLKIFADRVEGWQLLVADDCYRKIPHGGFGALYIVLSYFEMMGRYKEGNVGDKDAGEWFKKGFEDYATSTGFISAPEYQTVKSALYKGARCGLYHMGMTSKKVYIEGGRAKGFNYDATRQRLIIDPGRLIDEILAHFRAFLEDLKNPGNVKLRRHFEHKFDHDISPQIT